MLRLDRACLKDCPDALDVTMKTGSGTAALLAPSGYLVQLKLRHVIPEAVFVREYRKKINAAFGLSGSWLHKFLHQKAALGEDGVQRVTFGCYCKDGVFCHTHVLIDELVLRYPHIYEDARKERVEYMG